MNGGESIGIGCCDLHATAASGLFELILDDRLQACDLLGAWFLLTGDTLFVGSVGR